MELKINPIPKKLDLNITQFKLVLNPILVARFSIEKIW
jgi:hypothetical protein